MCLETCQGISNALREGSSTGKNIGVQYLLHSSFTGGRRYMVLNYQDGMAVCCEFGPPGLFCTFTCNPRWPEIADALLIEDGHVYSDRPDIVTRVFSMKQNEFVSCIKDGIAFGPVKAYLYVVEFQKRGLPHTHALLWIKENTIDATAAQIDSYVSAEILDPLGYALVEEFMIHGPCGAEHPTCPCMKDSSCSKRFPKSFNDETFVDGLGFPVYRRQNMGRYVLKNGTHMDNRWVVPYNLALLKKFQGHLNVEWCNKTNLFKYLFKYLTKDHDKARAVDPVALDARH